MGGGSTQTQQGPPQIVPEGRAGYEQAQGLFQGQIKNPPVYQGLTFAPATGTEKQAFQSASSLTDPTYAQAAVSSLAQPLFQKFEQETLPGIADQSQMAGQGLSSTRRAVATQEAIGELGQGLATGAVAPIYTAMPAALTAEANIGEEERQVAQQGLQAEQQRTYTDPLNTAVQAAKALFQGAGMGPGGTTVSTNLGALGTASAITGLFK